jgi:nicotinate-nucleotide pyrophosphorylase (carboxylating)
MQLDLNKVEKILADALQEDIGRGDITSELVIPENELIYADFTVREDCVVAGIPVLEELFGRESNKLIYIPKKLEGSEAGKGDVIFKLEGNARVILAFERVALNLLQYMCGVATLTRKFAKEVQHTKVKILDTRKTTPNLRILARYAVWIGGGKNHRFCLDDGILIKDNHISIVGDILKTIELAKSKGPDNLKIEVECDNLEQVRLAVDSSADIILLDNMNIEMLKKAVEINNGKCLLEASGELPLKM